MMGYGGYPAAGAGYEGGYQQQQSPFGAAAASPSAGSQQQKTKTAQSLRPVSVKQVLEATSQYQDSPLLIDGKELTQVVIVGRVNKVNVTSTAIVYTMDDGTGIIDVKKFTEQSDDDQDMTPHPIQDGGYVKIIGRVKVFNAKKSIDAHKIMPVDSVDEICHHILSICFTHLSITKPKPTARVGGNGAHDGNTFTGAAFGIESSIASNHSLSSVQREILSLFLQYTHNTEGGDISDVIYALRGTATAEQIREEAEFLCAEGLLYSTLDDNHFKLTGGN